MFELILVLLVISFACGYGLRAWISRRRRAAAREKFHAQLREKQLDDQVTGLGRRSVGADKEIDEYKPQ
jgi:type II secretory pathway pseudopilin PulG